MFEVYVRPLQPQQFAAPKSGGEVEVVELVHAAVFSLLEECAELIRGQRFHLFVFDFRQRAALCRIFRDEVLLDGEVVRRADHLVDVPHCFGSQTFRLFLGLDAVYSPAVQQVLVEPLQVQRGQVCQRDTADLRLDVVFQKALRGFEGGRSEFHLGIVFHPDFQPATHRVGFGSAFTADADYLLLDEPTNHLDRQGRKWFYEQLSRYQGGVLVASHDRELLAQVPRILELSALGLRSYGGNYADYRTQRDAEQLAARAALEHAATERKRTRARMHKEHDDSLRRSAKTLRTVDSLNIASFERVKYKGAAKERIGSWKKQHSVQNHALNAAVNQARERVEEDNAVMFTLPGSEIPEGKQVLVLEELVLPHVPVPPINWRMDGPMRVALRGPNGCGKSTLLKVMLGETAPVTGTCKVSVRCAYLDQHLSRLDLSQSVMTHLSLGNTPLEEGALRTRLAQLQLGAEKVTLPLAELSGGERLKAALACVLWREAATQLLLLDEPTNHLDLASVQAIEAALADYPGALLVVSHDEAFLAGLKLTHELVWEETGWRCESL